MKEKFVNIVIFLLVFLLSIGLTLAIVSNYVTITGSVTVVTTTSTSTTTLPIESSLVDYVVFSEVFYDTPGDDDIEEWIELYNPTSDLVDLSGVTIEDNTNSYPIPEGTLIAAGEFLVIARDETGFNNLYGFSPDLNDLTLGLNNGGDVLRLKTGEEEIDMVAWEDFVLGWSLEASQGESIQRYPPNQDTDTVSDWISHTTPNPGG